MDFITIKPLRSEFYFENITEQYIILTITEEGHEKDSTFQYQKVKNTTFDDFFGCMAYLGFINVNVNVNIY